MPPSPSPTTTIPLSAETPSAFTMPQPISDDDSLDDFLDAEDIHPELCPSVPDPVIGCDGAVQSRSDDPLVDLEISQEFRLHRAIFERQSPNDIFRMLTNWLFRAPNKTRADMVGVKDLHGNTPLHLAVMTGQREIVDILLANDAPIKSRNLQGWSPLDEAISYGDRTLIRTLLKKGRKQARKTMESRRPKLIKALSLIEDFQMELKWEFYSWVPLVKRFLPSDTCRLTKKGSSIRLDTTLVDFSDRSWQRGNITFLFCGEKSSKSSKALTILDNEMKVYQTVKTSSASTDIEEDIDILMGSDIMYPNLSTRTITFTRAQAGWWFSRYNKSDKVGHFDADFYNINGLTVETKKRREHLSEEDVQTNKQLIETLKKSIDSKEAAQEMEELMEAPANGDTVKGDLVEAKGDGEVAKKNGATGKPRKKGKLKKVSTGSVVSSSSSSSITNGSLGSTTRLNVNGEGAADSDASSSSLDDEAETLAAMKPQYLRYRRRKSLPSPPTPTHTVTWETYLSAPKGRPPCISRPLRIKESSRTFKATLAMSKDFPLSVEALLNVLEVVTPFKHFKKLREFIQLNLPPGFPVKIDIPIIPAILARVTFLNFEFNDKIADHLFDIPADYTEDPCRFPDI